MNIPQAVTSRYASNLLVHGSNDVFGLMAIDTHATVVNGTNLGTHYSATVATDFEPDGKIGYGATPLAAVRRALEMWGVTFR